MQTAAVVQETVAWRILASRLLLSRSAGISRQGIITRWPLKMAGSSNHNGGETFKVAVESILQRSIKEINYEGEETYEE